MTLIIHFFINSAACYSFYKSAGQWVRLSGSLLNAFHTWLTLRFFVKFLGLPLFHNASFGSQLFSNALCVLKSFMGQKAASYWALKRINWKIIHVSEAKGNQRNTLRDLPSFSLWTAWSCGDPAFADIKGHFSWSQDLTFGPLLASSNALLAHCLQW